MQDIIKGNIGSEGSYDVDFVGGKLIVNLNYVGNEAGVGLVASIGIDVLLDKVKEKIPGQIDDAVLDLLKAALKAV